MMLDTANMQSTKASGARQGFAVVLAHFVEVLGLRGRQLVFTDTGFTADLSRTNVDRLNRAVLVIFDLAQLDGSVSDVLACDL